VALFSIDIIESSGKAMSREGLSSRSQYGLIAVLAVGTLFAMAVESVFHFAARYRVIIISISISISIATQNRVFAIVLGDTLAVSFVRVVYKVICTHVTTAR
jgi:hypothetical protein